MTRSHDELRERFSAWMAENFTPARTANGGVRTRGGVVAYEDIHRLRPLLRGSVVEVVERFRRGESVPSDITQQIEEIIEVWDAETIRQMRRDQTFEQHLAQAVSAHRAHGRAPDGGSITAWARRVRARLGARLTDRARELWPEPAANLRRRELRGAS